MQLPDHDESINTGGGLFDSHLIPRRSLIDKHRPRTIRQEKRELPARLVSDISAPPLAESVHSQNKGTFPATCTRGRVGGWEVGVRGGGGYKHMREPLERARVIYGIICIAEFQVLIFKAIEGPKKKKLCGAFASSR